MSEKRYYKEADILRGIAIFLVILGHAILVYPIDLHEIPWCNALFVGISTVHMPLFFVISGFCYSFGETGHGAYLVKKSKRLVIPYFTFGILDTTARVLMPGAVNKQRGISDSAKDIFLYGGSYWFLYVLFLIFLIFPLLECVIKKFQYSSVFMLAALLAVRELKLLPHILMLDSVCAYLFFFMIGYLIRRNGSIWENIKRRLLFEKWISILVFGALWIMCVVFVLTYDNGLANFMASAFGLIALYVLAKIIANKKNYLLCQFSKFSLPLYLMNGYFLVISRTIIVTKLGCGNPVIIIGFNMLVTLICSWLFIKYVIDRIKPFKFICGMSERVDLLQLKQE